jgi:hypothetical protein
MKGPEVTLTNGRYEFRRSARGILSHAGRPEAVWRTRARLGPLGARSRTTRRFTNGGDDDAQHRDSA